MREVRRSGSLGSETAFDRHPPRSHWSVLMVRPSGGTPILATHTIFSLSACILDAALSPQSRQCRGCRRSAPSEGVATPGLLKHRGHGVEIETEVAVTTDELSLHPDVADGVELPQPKAEFHTDSDDHSGDDSNNHSGDDSDDDGQQVRHLYHLCVK